jgi:DNA repair protein RadC
MGDLKIQVPHTDPIIGASYYQPLDTLHITGNFTLHSHPSGDPEPSEDDLTITKRLTEAGKIIGIEVLDHIIIGDHTSFYSFKEKGVI